MNTASNTQQLCPIFIGGTNGSGTRLYAKLLELSGVYQGDQKNYAFEPESIIQYTKPLVPKLLRLTGSATYNPDDLPEKFRISMEYWIRDVGQEIQSRCPAGYQRWGWKHPRNMFLVPLLIQVFPQCYFLQVVRDGRDMVFASNKVDARVLFKHLETTKKNLLNRLRCSLKQAELEPYQVLQFWSIVNCEVANWCQQHLPSRFIISRFEDLCANPDLELRRISKAMQLEIDPAHFDKYTDLVKTPDSIDRWRTSPRDTHRSLLNSEVAGLQQFGYTQ